MTADIHQPQMQSSMARLYKAAEVKVAGRPRVSVALQMGNWGHLQQVYRKRYIEM